MTPDILPGNATLAQAITAINNLTSLTEQFGSLSLTDRRLFALTAAEHPLNLVETPFYRLNIAPGSVAPATITITPEAIDARGLLAYIYVINQDDTPRTIAFGGPLSGVAPRSLEKDQDTFLLWALMDAEARIIEDYTAPAQTPPA